MKLKNGEKWEIYFITFSLSLKFLKWLCWYSKKQFTVWSLVYKTLGTKVGMKEVTLCSLVLSRHRV